MLNDQILESLECASCSTTTFRHIARNPLTLSCGHSICKECVPSNDKIRVKCWHCKEINQTYLKTQKVSHSTVSLFNAFLKQLFNLLEERFKIAIHETTQVSFEENLKLKIDFVKEDIQVRFESLRHELDHLQQEIIENLESIKLEILKSDARSTAIETQKTFFKTKYQELSEKNNSKDINKSELDFFEYQKILKDLTKLNDDEDLNSPKISFTPSEFKFDLSHIGKIDYTMSKADIQVESSILKASEILKLNELCEFQSDAKWKLIYKASVHGFSAKDFHRHCDNHSNTLVIIKTTNNSVFGGFTSLNWTQTKKQAHYKPDKQAFLFSFSGKIGKYRVSNAEYAIFCDSTQCSIFGSYPSDLFICNNSNLSEKSYSNFPSSYGESRTNGDSPLGGQKNFSVKEFEVYKIDLL